MHFLVPVVTVVLFRSLIDLLVIPIQKSLDDWSKAVVQLDKDRNRGWLSLYLITLNTDLKDAFGLDCKLAGYVRYLFYAVLY